MKTPLILLLIFALLVLPCLGAAADDIVGTWYDQAKDAKIHIERCGENYCGKIVWLKQPNYPPDSKEGPAGTPKLDNNNPDSSLRRRPRLGLEIMRGFQFAGEDVWKDGKVYDPKSGKTYSGKITMRSRTELDLRGFVGISIFGRSEKWTKAD
jgi:uncharacterized protein (DUF2147 family)